MLFSRLYKVHEAIGVLAAVSVAAASVSPGTVASTIAGLPEAIVGQAPDPVKQKMILDIEHPSGIFAVQLEYQLGLDGIEIQRSGVIRTARLLAKGEVFIQGEQ